MGPNSGGGGGGIGVDLRKTTTMPLKKCGRAGWGVGGKKGGGFDTRQRVIEAEDGVHTRESDFIPHLSALAPSPPFPLLVSQSFPRLPTTLPPFATLYRFFSQNPPFGQIYI